MRWSATHIATVVVGFVALLLLWPLWAALLKHGDPSLKWAWLWVTGLAVATTWLTIRSAAILFGAER